MRPKLSALLIVAIVIAGGGAYAVTRRTTAPAAPDIPPPVPVVAGQVTSHDVPIYLRGIGTVIAYNTDVVRSQIQGQLTQVAFKEGQAVHAGDLLAQIDPRPYQAQLDQVTAARDRDQAQLTNALGQSRPLHAPGGQRLRHAATARHPEGAGRAACRTPSSRTRR